MNILSFRYANLLFRHNMELGDEEQEHTRKSHFMIIELITRLPSKILFFKERVHELESRVMDEKIVSTSTLLTSFRI